MTARLVVTHEDKGQLFEGFSMDRAEITEPA